jgi:TP901 family phage tail tape measure protein
MSLNVGTLAGVLELDARPFDDTLERSDSKTGTFSREAQRKVQLVGAAFVAAGVAAFGMSNDFNAGMANVASLIPGNRDRVNELKGAVQDLAISVGKDTGDIAGGLYQVESAFGDNADTVKILEINAKAATAGVAQTTEAIALTSAVTKGYGDTSAKAVQQAADLATLTVRLGQTTFPELAGSIGSVVPLTSALKVGQEELFAVMATATGVTGGASEVSTQLRGVMQSLMAPTAEVTKLMKEQGVADGQALVQKLGLKGTIDLLVGSAQKSGKPLQDYISSIEGQTLALSLAGAQGDTYKSKLGEMTKASGATDAAFKEQTEGVNKAGFQWQQLRIRATVAMQNMGDKIGTVLIPAMEWMMDNFEIVGPIAGVMAALVAAAFTVITVQAIIAGQSTLAQITLMVAKWIWLGVTSLASAAQVALAWLISIGPILLVAAAVVGLVALIVKNWDTIKSATAAVGRAIVGAFSAVVDWLRDNWPLVLAILTGPIGIAVLLIVRNWDRITEGARAMVRGAKELLGNLVEFVRSIPGKILEALGDVGRLLYDVGKKIIQGLIDGVGAMFGKVKDKFGDLTDKLTDWKGPEERDRTLLLGAGHLIMDGFVRGIEERRALVRSTLQDITNMVAAAGAPSFRTLQPALAAPGGVYEDPGAGGGGRGRGDVYIDLDVHKPGAEAYEIAAEVGWEVLNS